MTSEEIKATIGRLRECDNRTLPTIFDAFTCSLLGNHWCNNDVIEAIVALLEQADPETHMLVPRDADDMPIHIGDEMEGADAITNGQRCTVRGFELNNKGEWEWISDHQVRHKCRWWRRYLKPTVEDMLREFGDEVRMCCDTEGTIAEYAAKLREVMNND